MKFIRFENERSADRGSAYACDHVIEHDGTLWCVTVRSYEGAHSPERAMRMLEAYLAGGYHPSSVIAHCARKISA